MGAVALVNGHVMSVRIRARLGDSQAVQTDS